MSKDYEDVEPIRLNYGEMPSREDFVARFEYMMEGRKYEMELVGNDDVRFNKALAATNMDDPETFASYFAHKSGYRLNAEEMFALLSNLSKIEIEMDEMDEDEDANLASSIMTTLGYEWV